jgi:AraC-like DNA-binding protein
VRDLITLVRQASPSLGVRAWHVRRPEPHCNTSAHASIELAWTQEGAPEYVVGSRTMVLPLASVALIPARAEHRTTVTPGTRAKVLGLNHAVVEEVADAMGLRADLEASVISSPRLLRLCEHIFDEAVEAAPGRDLALDSLTGALAVELLRTDVPRTPVSDTRPADLRIRRALAYIDASFAQPLSLDAIAKVAGMSRFHFGRMFEAQVGKSPYRYLVDLRIERAAALLRTGKVSVTEAALSVGWNDLGRFGRAFRARFGVTPSEALASSRPKSSPAWTARLA